MTNTVLQLDNVEFRRNRRVIITDVNLTINAGERWVLFGPNGIGKSTAVGMLAARTFPSEGRVFILGHQLGKYDVFKLRTRIGLASADLGRQFPEFEDPLDAVVTGLSAVTGRWRDTYTQEEYARARHLLRDFRVSYLEGKEMWRLSEGERTRVLIARALDGPGRLRTRPRRVQLGDHRRQDRGSLPVRARRAEEVSSAATSAPPQSGCAGQLPSGGGAVTVGD